jgi:hypothetical protein
LRVDGARASPISNHPSNHSLTHRPPSHRAPSSAQLHLEDPGHNNIFTSAVGHEATVAVVVLSLLPVLLEAKRSLDGGDDEEFRPIPW